MLVICHSLENIWAILAAKRNMAGWTAVELVADFEHVLLYIADFI